MANDDMAIITGGCAVGNRRSALPPNYGVRRVEKHDFARRREGSWERSGHVQVGRGFERDAWLGWKMDAPKRPYRHDRHRKAQTHHQVLRPSLQRPSDARGNKRRKIRLAEVLRRRIELGNTARESENAGIARRVSHESDGVLGDQLEHTLGGAVGVTIHASAVGELLQSCK